MIFLEKHKEEAKQDPQIKILEYATWDVQPTERFMGKYFYMYKGDLNSEPRILNDNENF